MNSSALVPPLLIREPDGWYRLNWTMVSVSFPNSNECGNQEYLVLAVERAVDLSFVELFSELCPLIVLYLFPTSASDRYLTYYRKHLFS